MAFLAPTVQAAELKFDNTHPYRIQSHYARTQLLLDSKDSDVTHRAEYAAEPAGIITVNEHGLITPLKTGRATITATHNGAVAKTEVTCNLANKETSGFRHRVMAVLTKYGCNTCHGKPQGQNGFELSLFGFDPNADYLSIARGEQGRRISLIEPADSLALLKATASVPHGGGRRFAKDSLGYKTLHDWIADGAQREANETAPNVQSISVIPSSRVMTADSQQQLRVVAHYANETSEDVTVLCEYRTNDGDLAEVGHEGLVKVRDRRGQIAIVVTYRGAVNVFRGTIPFGTPLQSVPEPNNFVDAAVFRQLRDLGVPPSEVCSDHEFIRRASLDIAGRLPTPEQTAEFVADTSTDKRDVLIDTLLDSDDYPAYFANKWLHLLRNRRIFTQQRRGTYSFHNWLEDSFRRNLPYDQFARAIVAASGDMSHHPPATWYRDMLETTAQVEHTSQLFLGVRITCAKCHHHPFEKWSQKDYYSLSAFFSQVDRKYSLNGMWQDYERRIYHKRGVATAKHPATGEVLKPAVLDGPALDIDADTDPRQQLADWMAEPDNPYFATVLVNRYWKHFLGRGIVEPEDDLRDTNPPVNPELLDALRNHFVESGFDTKELIRTICRSKTYQLSAQANDVNLADQQSFSRFYPRRLNAEVLHDSIDQLLGTPTKFAGLPVQTRAVSLPDTGADNEFLGLFGKPKAETACECERSQAGDLRQSLYLLISSELTNKLNAKDSRAASYVKDEKRPVRERLQELYLRGYSRPATDQELQVATAFLETKEDKTKAWRDLLWVVINTKEFMYNH